MYASCYVRNNTLTIELGEALGIATQIVVALPAFVGVVVVFRREAFTNGPTSTNCAYVFCSVIPSCRWLSPCWDYCLLLR